MNKPRRSRVQGGWASTSNPNKTRSDAVRPKPPEVPAWICKNIDQTTLPSSRQAKPTDAPSSTPASTSQSGFQYVQPSAEEMLQKPADIIISKGGVYDISKTNNGLSRLRFFPNFFDKSQAEVLFAEMYSVLPWQETYGVQNGERVLEPRLTAWFADVPYSYSGVTHKANPNWLDPVPMIKEKVEDLLGYKFNSLLCNLYRNDKDSVGWHSDDEPELGSNPVIASLSFGDTRNFELRKKPVPNDGDYSLSQEVRVPLASGSLIVMEGSTQDDWQHRIPKEYHDRGPRINLTFRVTHALS